MNHELVFGPVALELNPGAVASETQGRCPGQGRVAVAFRSEALGGAARALLGSLPGARFQPGPCAAREVFSVDAEGLAQGASRCPEAAVLLEARKGLEREPHSPEIMGVVNVTPDSFSDGGDFLDPRRAVEHGLRLAAQGASILDIGGESTRPGAQPVPAREETRRVVPVVRELAQRSGARVSIDTTKAYVARAALDAGASIVNDVRAGEADEGMLPLIAERGCDYVIMHARGLPKDMQLDPRYDDAPSEVLDYLRRRVADCLRSGIAPTRIVVDPGIGFGKRLEHNTALLRRLPELRSLGRPLLLGVSRKSFIGHITGDEEPGRQRELAGPVRRPGRPTTAAARDQGAPRRLGGTAAAVTACVLGGAEIVRVHDVAVMVETVRVAEALRTPVPALLTTIHEQAPKGT